MNYPAGKQIAVLGLSYPFRGGIAHYSTLLVRELRRDHTVRFLTLSRQYPTFLFPGQSQYDDSAATITEKNEPVIDFDQSPDLAAHCLHPVAWRLRPGGRAMVESLLRPRIRHHSQPAGLGLASPGLLSLSQCLAP